MKKPFLRKSGKAINTSCRNFSYTNNLDTLVFIATTSSNQIHIIIFFFS